MYLTYYVYFVGIKRSDYLKIIYFLNNTNYISLRPIQCY